jgi:hypothetical protein
MHKSLTTFDRMLLTTYFDLKRAGLISRAQYMAVQADCRPMLQPPQPSEPFRPRKRRALTAAGPRR